MSWVWVANFQTSDLFLSKRGTKGQKKIIEKPSPALSKRLNSRLRPDMIDTGQAWAGWFCPMLHLGRTQTSLAKTDSDPNPGSNTPNPRLVLPTRLGALHLTKQLCAKWCGCSAELFSLPRRRQLSSLHVSYPISPAQVCLYLPCRLPCMQIYIFF